MPPITLALVDDHELVRAGLVAWLGANIVEVIVLATASTVDELRAGPGWGADVTLLDLNVADGGLVEDNISALVGTGTRIVVVSEEDTPAVVRRAVRAGCLGYVPKSASTSEMVEAIRAASRGETYLTPSLALALLAEPEASRPRLSPRELRTLQWYASGMPLKVVAHRLGISEGTVKCYVDRIRRKYQQVGREAPTKIDLYQRAVEDGYLSGV